MLDDLDNLVGELLEIGVGAFRLDSGRGVTDEKDSQHCGQCRPGRSEEVSTIATRPTAETTCPNWPNRPVS